MNESPKPNKTEMTFLTISYNRFYDLSQEMLKDDFWEKDGWYRLSKTKELFSVYAELLNYEPIKSEINRMKKTQPPMKADVVGELFKFIRNVIIHFPFFDSWDQIWINKPILGWYKEGQSMERFLEKYKTAGEVKYRIFKYSTKEMTYSAIKFPSHFENGEKVFLKDILSEKEGVLVSLNLMTQVLNTQIQK
jgi:hypothetical protein